MNALQKAKELGLPTVTLLGKDGGRASGLADVEVVVRHDVTARIQEAHQVLYHSLCEAIDSRLCCE